MKPRCNVHCHVFNFDFIPAAMIRLLSPFTKKVDAWDEFLATAGDILFLNKYNRARELLRTYTKDISAVATEYDAELGEAEIQIYTPLMMNVEEAAPPHHEKYVRYNQQVEFISTLAARFPWRMFAFVMFDPRQENSDAICIDALENKGFLGVKMYTALGYHPSPDVVETRGIRGDGSPPNSYAAERMRNLYKYCAEHKIPITAHASPGGAYSTQITGDRQKSAWPLTEPGNWRPVLEEYALKINLAHLGGDYLGKTKSGRQSLTWRGEILELIRESRKGDTSIAHSKVFADLSYHDMALKRKRKRYFQDLGSLLAPASEHRQGLIFGTDASMISHSWTEAQYIKPFQDPNNLVPGYQDLIFTANPSAFLFENGVIPERYVRFLRARYQGAVPEPKPWVEEVGGVYRIQTA